MGQSSRYYLQGNGLAKSINKTLIQVLKNIISDSQKNWHKKLNNELWVSMITPKESTSQFTYLLVYGKESILPINLKTNELVIACQAEE